MDKPPRKKHIVLKVVLIIALLLVLAAVFVPSLGPHTKAHNEAVAMGVLRQMSSHQKFFRELDADGNGKQDYWTADMAGFYALPNKEGGMMKYIYVELAKADAAPLRDAYSWTPPEQPEPYAGYYFKAMLYDETGTLYRQDADGDGKKYTNPSKYAYCAYPVRYGKTGFRTGIINETGILYVRDMNGQPVDRWPAEDPTTIEGLDNPWGKWD